METTNPHKFSPENRRSAILLAIGLLLHCVALNQPIVDAHLLRQAQTASWTQSMWDETGFHLSGRIAWTGDLPGRFILELPVYNCLVLGVNALVGNLDMSGKLVTIFFWVLGFLILQPIWRRLLSDQQIFWANTLYVLSPLNTFFGQAFMPEMLIQATAFLFVWRMLVYWETPNLLGWVTVVATGVLALLLKLPETAHLYLLLGAILFTREGWKVAIRPRYLAGMVLTLAAVKGWSAVVDAVNGESIPIWSGNNNLLIFFGNLADRLDLKAWCIIGLYLGVLLAPGLVSVGVGVGLARLRHHQSKFFVSVWLVALALFYLAWFGNAGTKQSYYNLPALAPFCVLFAIGMDWLLQRYRLADSAKTRVAGFIVIALFAVPGTAYLFRRDAIIHQAALWARDHIPPGEPLIFQANHRNDMVHYPYNAVVAYYSRHPTFIWTPFSSSEYQQHALDRSRYVMVTKPVPRATGMLGGFQKFRGDERAPRDMSWLEQKGFTEVASTSEFVLYQKK